MFRDQILPLLITQLLPPASGGSADSPGIGVASDGRQYVLKVATATNPLLPATEAFCASLATACQLPVAAGAWLEFPGSGPQCYGSRLEGGVVSTTPLFGVRGLAQDAIKRRWLRCDNRAVAAGHYVLDLFLFNYDHHLNNWLFQEMGSRLEVMGIDYSRAFWVVSRDPAALPPPAAMLTLDPHIERTVMAGRLIRRWVGFDHATAGRTLAILKNVPISWVQNFSQQIPSDWMTDYDRAALADWWQSPARLARIDAIEQGISDGSLL